MSQVKDKRRFNKDGSAKKRQPPRTGPNPKRNRKERLAAVVYRVEHLFQPRDSDDAQFSIGQVHHIEGELDDRLIVSVPEITSEAAAAKLQGRLEADYNQPVMVVTHNISLMRAVRLPPKQAAEIIKNAEDAIQRELERLGEGGDADGDGS